MCEMKKKIWQKPPDFKDLVNSKNHPLLILIFQINLFTCNRLIKKPIYHILTIFIYLACLVCLCKPYLDYFQQILAKELKIRFLFRYNMLNQKQFDFYYPIIEPDITQIIKQLLNAANATNLLKKEYKFFNLKLNFKYYELI